MRRRSSLISACVGTILILGVLTPESIHAADAPTKITGKTLTIVHGPEDVVVKQSDQLLLRYRYRDVPNKPYVAEMTSPGGVNLLRDAPSDHLHHHALMFAWSVNGVNFWEENDQSGSQIHEKWLGLRIETDAGLERAVLRESVTWKSPDGKVLLEELRTLIIRAAAEGQPSLLTWQAQFTPGTDVDGAVTLGGAEYNGLGMRMIRPMDSDGVHFNAAGGRMVAGTNLKNATWNAYTAPVDAREKVTVAMFDAPGNPRHPTRWFTMGEKPPFAYLSATMGIGQEPLQIEKGKKLTVRFGLAIFQGAVDADRVNAAYKEWSR